MQDLKEKKEKVEEKAGRKERKKEVVEVWRWPRSAPTSFPSSYLPGDVGVLPFSCPPPFLPYPESFHRPVSGNTASLTVLAPCLGPHRRRRMELRRRKKKLPRMERMMMKEMKKVGRGREGWAGRVEAQRSRLWGAVEGQQPG